MEKDDLTRIKHIGAARMKLLNQHGIATVDQLHQLPLEELASIRTIGAYYARLIKDAVAGYVAQREDIPAPKALSAKERKGLEVNRDLRKQLKRLKKRQKRLNEDLKPLWKKKYLPLYLKFKKRSNKLKTRINKIEQLHQELPNKAKKKIIKRASAVNLTLKKVGKKPKTKDYMHTTQELQAFSTMLRDIRRSAN